MAKTLNLLEIVIDGINEDPTVITNEKVMEIAPAKVATFMTTGEQQLRYYFRPFIKSFGVRIPMQAVYWLARMIGRKARM